MNDNIADQVDCILFDSGKISYILPSCVVIDVVPLEKTAIILRRSGLILGRQKFKEQIVPIVNLQPQAIGLFANVYPKLLIIRLIDTEQAEAAPIAILLDNDPFYESFSRLALGSESNAKPEIHGQGVMIHHKKAIIPDINYLAKQIEAQL
jgi:hypothetical protein